MDVVNTKTVTAASQLAAAQPQTTAALASDFETFLKMLTAQARYQDPLEPIDSSEYAAQLAQFSMVEQQVLSNDLLTGLGTQLASSSIGQAASWIGMEARTMSPAAFDGAPITVLPTIEAGADQAVLLAYDAQGKEVERRQISTEGGPLEWSGVLASGAVLPNGNYSFKVESLSLGKPMGTSAAETYTQITEARRQGNEAVFVLDSGTTVTAAQVTALRQAL